MAQSDSLIPLREISQVAEFFRAMPEYSATPLRRLENLARKLGVGEIYVKDESARLGLNSFKALGVSYAVGKLLKDGEISARRADGSPSVLVCASAGNHGRAVARFAHVNGFGARVYVSNFVGAEARRRIAKEGAELVVVEGGYDDSVAASIRDADERGAILISDMSWRGYEKVPRLIMAGYTMLMTEAAEQWNAEPTVVIVQVGVGGLLGGVLGWICARYGAKRPAIIAAEPVGAACLRASLEAGKPVTLPNTSDTIMTGLNCATVSHLVWPMAQANVDACVTISDDDSRRAIEQLARPLGDDPEISAGPSGACGLGALMSALGDPLYASLKAKFFGADSRVLLINSEAGASVRN